jgi:hypothetical protein
MDKKLLIIFGAIIIVIIVVVSQLNFGPSTIDQEKKDDTDIPKEDIINIDDYIPATSGSVSGEGGQVSVSDSTNPLYGLNIEVPKFSADEPIDFEISYTDVTEISGLPEDASIVSKLIKIDTDGSTSWNNYKTFDKEVLVTLPYDPNLILPGETVRFYAYDDEVNALSSAGFISQDTESNTISFYTRTFSSFIAVKLSLKDSEYFDKPYSIDTGFRPKEDGFFIRNYGSYLKTGGICMGMVTYARHYFMWKKASDGTALYEKYREGDRNEWRDDATAIEIGTRAQMAESGVWAQTLNKELGEHWPTSREVALTWIHGMVVTEAPQLIAVYHSLADGSYVGGHAVMTYKYSNGVFDVYDPNFPGTEPGTVARQIPFNYTYGFTKPYSSGTSAGSGTYQYNIFHAFGYKAFHPFNAFEQLYDSAEKGFEDDSIFPTITLTDYNTGGTTPTDTDNDGIRDSPELTTTISGTIKGRQKKVNSTLIFISNQKFVTPVDANGVFSQEVPLYGGENDLIILGTDENTFTNWSGYLRDKIYSSASNSSIKLTLTWRQDNCDLDLHVMEPTIEGWVGRHMFPHGGQGADSGYPYMTINNMEGFGPEHYFASENMTLPNYQGDGKSLYGTYEIRVHYMYDTDEDINNTQPVDWRVELDYLAFHDEKNNAPYWRFESWEGKLTEADFHHAFNFYHDDNSGSYIFEFEYKRPNPQDYAIQPPPQNNLPN